MGARNSTDAPQRVTLSVGGMTCASCSSAIADTLSGIVGVMDPAVNLIGNSATMIVQRKELVDTVVAAVRDTGFEADVFDVVPLASENDRNKKSISRTVTLRVGGMFCRHCPQVVMASLAMFGSSVTILEPLKTPSDTILRISYKPNPPQLTIRHIISAISNAKSPPFQVSIHRPPTVEEVARTLQCRQQRDLLVRLAVTVVIGIPTFVIGIVYMSILGDHNPGKRFFMEPMWVGNASRLEWALLFLATPVMFYSANVFHRRAVKEIRAKWRKGSTTPILQRFTRFGSMNLLVSTGVSVAYFASIALLCLAATQPAPMRDGGMKETDISTYFDSVVFLTMFLLAGRWLEAYSKAHTADAITSLGKLRPTEALLLTPESPTDQKYVSKDTDVEKGGPSAESGHIYTLRLGLQMVSVDLLEIGDIVRVRNGSTPPADGEIVQGKGGAFDESALTGESRLIKKQRGDLVFVGTYNRGNPVDVQITAIEGETMLNHVIQAVRDGQSRRAPIERVASLLTGYFVPVATLLAIVTWLVWLTLGLLGALPNDYLDIKIGGWPVWSLQFSIAVFVVACPCGIGLAAPTALLVGSGLAARFGILARGGGEAFQEMAQVDIVAFDKTGTLTHGGEPRVSDAKILSLGDDDSDTAWNPRLVLGMAAEMESASAHPLAIAIRSYCAKQGTVPANGSDFEEVPGRGLKATFTTQKCSAVIGNEAWMLEHSVSLSKGISARLDMWKSEAKSVVLLAISRRGQSAGYKLAAVFAVTDPLRSEARGVIAALHRASIETWMISGDNATTAAAVARMVGIPPANVIAGVLPSEKAAKVQWLQKVGTKRQRSRLHWLFKTRMLNERCIVAMVGDGINDAPALTASDIGIAIGSGSDVAISCASFVLVSSNLRSLLTLSDLATKVFRRIKFNFAWAIVYNSIALPVAAGVLFPIRHIRLDPVWASLAMALSSVSVVCSSLLLKLYKEPMSE